MGAGERASKRMTVRPDIILCLIVLVLIFIYAIGILTLMTGVVIRVTEGYCWKIC
jgi:hypothetical protein